MQMKKLILIISILLITYFATSVTKCFALLPAPVWVNDGVALPDIDWSNSANTLSANWAEVPGAAGYKYAIGTAPDSTDVVYWTDAGLVTSVTRSGLTLIHNTTYYFLVKAYDANMIEGDIASSDGVTIDLQPPRIYMSFPGNDWYFPIDILDIMGIWVIFNEPIKPETLQYMQVFDLTHQHLVSGTLTPYDTVVVVFKPSAPLEYNTQYEVRLSQLTDLAGYPLAEPSTFRFTTMPPLEVNDGLTPPDIDLSNSPDTLSANWTGVFGGYVPYKYAIGTTPGGTDVVNWTDAGAVTSVTRPGLSLTHNTTYYFSVRAYFQDPEGGIYEGRIASSDGVTIDLQPPISQVNPLTPTQTAL